MNYYTFYLYYKYQTTKLKQVWKYLMKLDNKLLIII